MIANVMLLLSFLPLNAERNRIGNKIEELREEGIRQLWKYHDAVDPSVFSRYETQWNYRVSCLARAAKEGDLLQFILVETERFSNRLNEKYDSLPCNDKKFHQHQGPCNVCAVYRLTWQPFNPYYIQHEPLPTEYFYELRKEQRFEYLAVHNYIKLESLLLDHYKWDDIHPLILWYLRDTPKGDEEYKLALNGKFNRIQCSGCRPKTRG